MKTLFLVQKPQLRGAEIFASQLASRISQAGHEALIVFLYPGDAQLAFNCDKVNLNSRPQKRFWDIKAWYRLAQIIKHEQPDIIQANAGDTLKYAIFSRLLFRWKQPIVFRNASTISLYIKSWPVKLWNSFLFRYAQKIISVSNMSAFDFATLFPQFHDKVIVIPGGIEQVELEEEKALPSVNDMPGGPLLVHVGGFTYEKNHIRLISIFERILKRDPTATLQLVGDGPLRKDIEEIVKQKGLNEKVIFYGYRKDAIQLINNADVLLLPSVIEGLPGVILEAFFCRTPVVAYDVGGIGEVLINSETGYLVRLGDESAFVEAVIVAAAANDSNKRMIENAYGLVTSYYLNTHISQKFIDVYQSLICRN